MFGLRLDLKINVLALAAFLLSTGSLAWQAIEMWRGPRVEMAAGERINFLKRSHTAQPDMPYPVVNARLDYVNEGAVGRNTTIAAERLNLRFANWKPYEYRWLHFELIVSDAEGKPVVETRDGAHSVLVPGGSAASHQTTFVAFRDASGLKVPKPRMCFGSTSCGLFVTASQSTSVFSRGIVVGVPTSPTVRSWSLASCSRHSKQTTGQPRSASRTGRQDDWCPSLQNAGQRALHRLIGEGAQSLGLAGARQSVPNRSSLSGGAKQSLIDQPRQ